MKACYPANAQKADKHGTAKHIWIHIAPLLYLLLQLNYKKTSISMLFGPSAKIALHSFGPLMRLLISEGGTNFMFLRK